MGSANPEESPGWNSLSLSFRELFRILVPGTFMFFLLRLLSPVAAPAWLSETAAGMLGSVFFLGSLVYALRVHELVWPYSVEFRRLVKNLNDCVAEASNGNKTADQKDLYKYFIESRVPAPLRERIHYFSSFYYMLTSISFLSLLGALGSAAWLFHSLLRGDSSYARLVALPCFLLVAWPFHALAKKQWKSIIDEQCVLVQDLRGSLGELASRCTRA
jgi:hypothetical protein